MGADPILVEEFMVPFDEKPPAVNIGVLVGHARIRRQIMGPDYKRPATPDEVGRMGELVSDAMKQGAFGLASDLQQEPASFSTPDELLSLAKVVAKFGGAILLTPGDAKSAVALARDAKLPVQVITKDKRYRRNRTCPRPAHRYLGGLVFLRTTRSRQDGRARTGDTENDQCSGRPLQPPRARPSEGWRRRRRRGLEPPEPRLRP